jgi:hypothetical protein
MSTSSTAATSAEPNRWALVNMAMKPSGSTLTDFFNQLRKYELSIYILHNGLRKVAAHAGVY